MEKFIGEIIPDTQENYDSLNPSRLNYTYLHGEIMDECDYDCYGLINCYLPNKKDSVYLDASSLPNGKYDCVYNGKECTLYFWHSSRNDQHGLVVYNHDLNANLYADAKLKNKSYTI